MAVIFTGKTINNNYKITNNTSRPPQTEVFYSVDVAQHLGRGTTYLIAGTQYTVGMDFVLFEAMMDAYEDHRPDLQYSYVDIAYESPQLYHSSFNHTFVTINTQSRTMTINAPDTSAQECTISTSCKVSVYDPVTAETKIIDAYIMYYFNGQDEFRGYLNDTGMFVYDPTHWIDDDGELYPFLFDFKFVPFEAPRFSAYQDLMGIPSTNHIAGSNETRFDELLGMDMTFTITGIDWKGSGSVGADGIYSGTYGPMPRPYEDWAENQTGEIVLEYRGYSATYEFHYQVDGEW